MRGLALLFVLAIATEAVLAHGGGFPHAPPLRFGRRGIPCSCAKVECVRCTPQPVRSGKEISRCSTNVTELKRWGDIAQVRVTVTFETNRELGAIEGFVKLTPAPIFAAVSGRVESVSTSVKSQPEAGLTATLMDSETARRTYLWTRRWYRYDPLLVLRRGPGEVHVRAFPVSRSAQLRVVIEGYALLPRSELRGVSLYQTGKRILVVGEKGDHRFLFSRECRTLHGSTDAVEVPCLAHLESAATGYGRAAASNEVALAAFPPGALDAPYVGLGAWGPGSVFPPHPPPIRKNDAVDPGPPPPPLTTTPEKRE